MTGTGLETWRGGVQPWQCDENGHMNVQFYVEIAMEALVGLAAAMGMPRAFSAGASATLAVREHHVRFLREARPGAVLAMTGGVISLEETGASLLQILTHLDTGEPAATFVTRVEHVTPRDLRPFPWPHAVERRAADLTMTAPAHAGPRGISAAPSAQAATLKAAVAMGLPIVSSGAVDTRHCDVFDRMRPEHLLSRIYASVGHLIRRAERAVLAAEPDLADRLGGALVEYRAVYHAWPRPGDRLALYSGHTAISEKSRNLVHWMLDPTGGGVWATAEIVGLFLDLKTRKSLLIPGPALEVLSAELFSDLAL